jgi:hypothetical protein
MDERGALEELFTATLDAFVETRARLAAALSAAGRKADGQALKKVRRPSPSAWATNQVVRRARAEVDAFLGASERLRASQGAIVAGRGDRAAYQADAGDLRRATAALTAAARRILEDLGRADDRPIIERVVANARAAALTEAGRAALLAGALVADLDGEVDAFGGLLTSGLVVPPAAPASRTATTARAAPGPSAREDEARRREEERTREAEAARREETEARAAVAAAEAALARAREGLGEARRHADEAQQAARDADRARHDAEVSLRDAQRAVAAAETRASRATRRREAAGP